VKSGPSSEDFVFPPDLVQYDWEGAHARILSFFAHRRCLEADDLTQETLMRAIRWLSSEGNSINGEDGFVKLLYGFARNVLLEHYRRQNEHVRRELPIDDIPENPKQVPNADPDNILAMKQAFSRLSAEERDCLYRAEFQAPEKAAGELGIPLATFRVKVCRARKRLRRLVYRDRNRDAGNFPRDSAIDRLEQDLAHE
jgi:RNA polymerase sigma factor (sigma-70 family)